MSAAMASQSRGMSVLEFQAAGWRFPFWSGSSFLFAFSWSVYWLRFRVLVVSEEGFFCFGWIEGRAKMLKSVFLTRRFPLYSFSNAGRLYWCDFRSLSQLRLVKRREWLFVSRILDLCVTLSDTDVRMKTEKPQVYLNLLIIGEDRRIC